jgi:tripartite-type tricarboxylate transporter receptor subunit TctC
MQELSGQQWIVENKGGSGGNVGMDALAQSPADGYTLGLGGIASHAIAPTLYAKLPFKVPDDFTFVSMMWQLPNMLVVNLDLPAKTVPELIELLRKNPGKYSYASAGNGTTLHLSGELFKVMAKVDMLHVPYRGAAPAMQDLLAGQVSMIFDNIPGALAQVRAGKVRALGVTSKKRVSVFPDVAPIADTVPGYEATNWHMVIAPAQTPPAVVEKLSAEFRAVGAMPEVKQQIAKIGLEPLDSPTAPELKKFLDAEIARWAKFVTQIGLAGSL